jgi:hypothetical protein
MADMVMYRGAHVLGVHKNVSKVGTTAEKIYRTAYLFVDGPEEGFERPQMVEASIMDDAMFSKIKAAKGKTMDLVGNKQTYRNGESRVEILGTLSEFLKGAA